jgi:hypothetical protein
MNKYLGGCLIALAILVVGGGAVGYFVFIKPAGEFVSRMMEYGKEFEALNEGIANQDDYDASAETVLSSQQVQKFLDTHRFMKAQMDAELRTLDAKYKELNASMKQGQRDMDLTEIASAYLDIGDLIMEAKRAQVAALNQQDFSLQEYDWVRSRVYHAIGQSVGVAAIGEARKAGFEIDEVSEEDLKLVEPYRKELLETHVLAWFGL